METIKIKFIAALLVLLINSGLKSQTQEELRTAFSKSYTLEFEKKYANAANSLLKVYS